MYNDAFDKSENLFAMNVIQEFFAFHGLQHALHDMEQMIYYASGNSFYKKASPYNLVYFGDCLRKFLQACLVLSEESNLQNAFEVKAAENGLPDMSRTPDYLSDSSLPHWHYLPRHLGIKQYLNPMTAFKKLKKYQSASEWMKTIDDLTECALSTAKIDSCLPSYNVLKLRKRLLQVIEAGHLMVVRYESRNGNEG